MLDERIPPQAIDAETCVLGAMLLDVQAVMAARTVLAADDFYRPAHQIIYAGLLEMTDNRSRVDLVTARHHFTSKNTLAEVGGIEYLVGLVEGVPNTANMEYYAKIVKDCSVRRSLIVMAKELADDSYRGMTQADDLLSGYQQKLYDLDRRTKTLRGNESTLADAAAVVMKRAEEASQGGAVVGVNSGFARLDEAIHGFRPGHLTTLGAGPGVGKTSLALRFCANVARNGGTCLYISAEMPADELAQRFLQSEADVFGGLILDGTLRVDDWQRLNDAEAVLKGWNVYLVGKALDLAHIALKTRETATRFSSHVDLVVVDYLQIMRLPDGGDTREKVTRFTSGLKQLALELGVPILALSQFARESMKAKQLPTMHDLKESGSIENDSNEVLLLHRPDPIRRILLNNREHIECWLKVAKCRDGMTTPWPNDQTPSEHEIRVKWFPGQTRFEE